VMEKVELYCGRQKVVVTLTWMFNPGGKDVKYLKWLFSGVFLQSSCGSGGVDQRQVVGQIKGRSS